MWSSWGGHGVVLGAADGFCLVCAARLRDARRAALHVAGAPHRHALSASTYFHKYKHDLIRKVKNGYFCQFCNKLLTTAAQVGLHIAETRHKENKEIQLLRRVSDGVVAFGDVLIQDDAWNGLIEDTCVLCNTDYDDKTVHQAENEHILKLIQSKVLFGDKKTVYRNIDDSTFHCLTCNYVYPTNSFAEHFDSMEHVDTHKKSNYKNDTSLEWDFEEITVEDINLDNSKKYISINDANKDSKKSDGDKIDLRKNEDILNSVAEFQKKGVNIDFINERAQCKTCSKNVDFDCETIRKHIEDHKVTPKKEHAKVPFESGTNGDNKQSLYTKPVFLGDAKENKSRSGSSSSKDEMESFIKEHKLSYKGNKLYCNECGTRIEASIKNVKHHVHSNAHIKARKPNSQANKAEKKRHEKVLIETFVKNIAGILHGAGCHDFVINEKICINIFSFMFIGFSHSGVACLGCNVSISQSLDSALAFVIRHINSPDHEKSINESLVIVSLDSEFVREIRPDLFHCGFCNIVEENWGSMEGHLESSMHRNMKSAADRRLQAYISQGLLDSEDNVRFTSMLKKMADFSIPRI